MAEQPEAPRYGGRALRNGVMMVGPGAVAVAVRKADGGIEVGVEPFTMSGSWAKNIPFVRGLVSFGGMLRLARLSSRLENKLGDGHRVKMTLPQLAPGIGAAIAERLTAELARRTDDRLVAPIEAAAGLTLPFMAFAVSGRLPGVRELWRYHGAEHKAVNAAEAGLELTPRNARHMSRIHPRCGTTMAFWGLVGGSVARLALGSMPAGRRKTVLGLVSGPLVMASAYEALRLGANLRDHPIGKLFFIPAWQSQRFTTSEPSEEELEVAIAALQAVMDHEEAAA
ncbi:MAG: DUF1385 domain-containing protein [Chloroflexota bacterium]